MRFCLVLLAIVPTAVSQLFQDGGTNDLQVNSQIAAFPGETDALDGMLVGNKPLGNSQKMQPVINFDAGTADDQAATPPLTGAKSPPSPMEGFASPSFVPLQLDPSLQSNSPQPPIGPGASAIPQPPSDTSQTMAQGCSFPPGQTNPVPQGRKMLLRGRETVCRNIPQQNDNPILYPGGEGQRIEDLKVGRVQPEKQCDPWRKTACCNGPRRGLRDLDDCGFCMFRLDRKFFSSFI